MGRTALLLSLLFLHAVASAEDAQEVGGIDVHMHLIGQPSHPAQQGVMRRARGPQRDYEGAALELIARMDELGIRKSVVMPPPQTKDQKGPSRYTEFLDVVRGHSDRLAFAGGGDILNPMIMAVDAGALRPPMKEEFRRRALKIVDDGAAAFGEMTALHFSFSPTHVFEQAPADHPLFLLLADISAEHHIPIDIHMEALAAEWSLSQELAERSDKNPARVDATLPGFERLLAHERGAAIVWQHVGWDNTGQMTPELVRRLLKDHPNLYCALKHVRKQYEPFQKGPGLLDEQGRLRAEWAQLIADFSDRFMIGADDFIMAGGKRKVGPPSLEDSWSLIDQLPDELQAKVGWENAERIYRLS